MKILATFFCLIVFVLLVLLATVDLEPFLTPENNNVEKTAIASREEAVGKTEQSKPSAQIPGEISAENPSLNSSEPGMSKITTHQLVVTEKKETENFGNKTNNGQTTLPTPGDKAPAPLSETPED